MSWSIPKWDNHFNSRIKKGEYQKNQRDFALGFVEDWDIAIDIGANIGLWTKPLCEKFRFVWAFEPSRENWEHCHKNLEGIENYQLEQVALSDKQAENIELYSTSDSCGDLRITPVGLKALVIDKVDMMMLDNYYHELMPKYAGKIGLIKIDVQQHEKEVLLGATRILEEHSPVICIELPTRDEEEQTYKIICKNILGGLGYREKGTQGKETIFIKA
tara:strand:+ start:51 stop:701 length:651 start_codon:yes stop_codon:yes gene_type:complete